MTKVRRKKGKRPSTTLPNGHPWINPVGGYGDMLMLGGILRQIHQRDPSKKFNLIRRSRYTNFFWGHEAIAAIGHPMDGETIMHTTYWAMEQLGPGTQRAYQVLARAFGLETPAEEILYVPQVPDSDPILMDFVPWKRLNVVIAPASDSPRKTLHPETWHRLVEMLLTEGVFVVQVGLTNELRIRNAYSLLGQTDPRQLVKVLERAHLVVCADNFIMHAAHLAGIPSVVTWGPTQHEVYGYPGHHHIQKDPRCGLKPGESCLVSPENRGGSIYGTPCPLKEEHCLAQVTPEEIYLACQKVLARR